MAESNELRRKVKKYLRPIKRSGDVYSLFN